MRVEALRRLLLLLLLLLRSEAWRWRRRARLCGSRPALARKSAARQRAVALSLSAVAAPRTSTHGGPMQCEYDAVHKQWSDVIVFQRGGKFWRTENGSSGGWTEQNRFAGRWETAGTGLTLKWSAWPPEQLQTQDGGRTFQCTGGYKFTLSLPVTKGAVPQWLFGEQSAEHAQMQMRRLLQKELERLRQQQSDPSPPRVVQLFRDLTLRLRPFAQQVSREPELKRVPNLIKSAFEAAGWNVRNNVAALDRASPPTAAELETFLLSALDAVCGKRPRDKDALTTARSATESPPQLSEYTPFIAQQQADHGAAVGDCPTLVLSPEWCSRAEPSMGDVSWGLQKLAFFGYSSSFSPSRRYPPISFSPNGHGVVVPRSTGDNQCVLWNWVAHAITELTYPDPRMRPELTLHGSYCWAASLLLEQHCRPREPRETRCLLLTAASGNVYLISRDNNGVVSSHDIARQLTITRLARPMHTCVRSAADGTKDYQHLTLLCGTVVGGGAPEEWSTEVEGLVFYAEDIVSWQGRTMMRRPGPIRAATIEAELVPLWDYEQNDAAVASVVQQGGLETIRHRPKPHREDWGFGSAGVTEFVDDRGLELYDGCTPSVHDRTKFQREYTMCFWIKISQFEPSEDSNRDDSRILFERGSTSIGPCPCVFLDSHMRLGVRANVDPGPECALRSREPLALDTWTHIAISVQQSQRALELLINGDIDQRDTMSAHGKLFTDGEGLPLSVGLFTGDAKTTCCISHLQVFPTCSLSRGSAKQVFEAQRLILRELVTRERPADIPAAIVELDASLDLMQRTQKVSECDDRAGWPQSRPGVLDTTQPIFCAPQNRVVLAHQLSEATQCVIELGAFLGATTRFIQQHAPNAIVFAVDQWVNEELQHDPDYSDEEIQRALKTAPIYDFFVKNLWNQKLSDDGRKGVVPLRIRADEALRWLHAAEIYPDLIYVDTARHYEPVFSVLSCCCRLFPEARLCGAAWDHVPVQRAVREIAWRYGNSIVHVEVGKSWALGSLENSLDALASTRRNFYENEGENEEDFVPLFKEVVGVFGDGHDAEAAVRHLLGLNGNCSHLPIDFVAPPKGRTLLMTAALQGHVGIARVLVEEFNADVNAQNKQKGETALHLSAYRGQLSMVKFLLSSSASTSLRNAFNETAAETAEEAGKNNQGAASCAAFINKWMKQ